MEGGSQTVSGPMPCEFATLATSSNHQPFPEEVMSSNEDSRPIKEDNMASILCDYIIVRAHDTLSWVVKFDNNCFIL